MPFFKYSTISAQRLFTGQTFIGFQIWEFRQMNMDSVRQTQNKSLVFKESNSPACVSSFAFYMQASVSMYFAAKFK